MRLRSIPGALSAALAFAGPVLGCLHHAQLKQRMLPGPSVEISARFVQTMKRGIVDDGGDPLQALRLIPLGDGIFSYYDGRDGKRLFDQPNFADDGARKLGVSTYSITSGDTALLIDAGISNNITNFMLDHVASLNVTKTFCVITHFHSDHIAGAEALVARGTTLISNNRTVPLLQRSAARLAQGFPPINVQIPTQLYDDETTIQIGAQEVQLLHFNVHSTDHTNIFLADKGIMFTGDTTEDTCTFIAEPENLEIHKAELRRMLTFPIKTVFPAHGSDKKIETGGYDTSFINATISYIERITEPVARPAAWDQKLAQVMAPEIARGELIFFAEYEGVHLSNVRGVQQVRGVDQA